MEYYVGQLVSFKMTQESNSYSSWFIPLCKNHREGVILNVPSLRRDTSTYRIKLLGEPIQAEFGRKISEIFVTKKSLTVASLYQEVR